MHLNIGLLYPRLKKKSFTLFLILMILVLVQKSIVTFYNRNNVSGYVQIHFYIFKIYNLSCLSQTYCHFSINETLSMSVT